MRPRRLLVPLLLAIVLFAASCREEVNILNLGDSWAAGWKDALAAEIRSHGDTPTITDIAVPGSTAVQWADPNLRAYVQAQLVAHPEIDWVMISLGGNDLLQGFKIGGLGDSVFPILDQALRQVIDAIVQVRPDVKISLNGYDFLNFEMTPECVAAGQEMLGGTTYLKNLLVAQITVIAEEIDADYPQVTTVDLIGTLQKAAGVPKAPDYEKPSPASLMGDGDCIHPNAQGYREIQSAIYDGFFGPLAGR
jgi:lysophospholipase L1-like esterase